MSIKHFGDRHPLILFDEDALNRIQTRAGKPLTCQACGFYLDDDLKMEIYGCWLCRFFIHKQCLELPMKIRHHFHPQHTLTLGDSKTIFEDHVNCSSCQKPTKGFVYECEFCDFKMDLLCASSTPSIVYKDHEHPLTFDREQQYKDQCDSCNGYLGIYNRALVCRQCEFTVHYECGVPTLPATIKHKRHYNPLHFTKYLIEEDEDEYYCDVCEEQRDARLPVYYDAEDKFIAHVSCVIPEMVPSEEAEWSFFLEIFSAPYGGYYDKVLPSISRGEWSPIVQGLSYGEVSSVLKVIVDMIRRKEYTGQEPYNNSVYDGVISEEKQEENPDEAEGFYKQDTSIMHFSHQHPLTVLDENEIEQIFGTMENEKLCNTKKLCYACRIYIPSAITYCCTKCYVILQEPCLHLPMKIHHYFHPHPLTLRFQELLIFKCSLCSKNSGGFVYTCYKCNFNIDIGCAPLTPSIRHRDHEHALLLHFFSFNPPCCAVCNKCISDSLALICKDCNFSIHYECGGPKLPDSIVHKCHSYHTLHYTKFLIEEDEEEFYCDVCEEPRDPNLPVYYCAPCKYIAHISCVIPEITPEGEWSFFYRLLGYSPDSAILPLKPEAGFSPFFQALFEGDLSNVLKGITHMTITKKHEGVDEGATSVAEYEHYITDRDMETDEDEDGIREEHIVYV